MEGEYEVQERLLLQPHCYSVVLESKYFEYPRRFSLMRKFILILLCFLVITDSAADGWRKENPAPAVCDWNIQGPHEWLC